MGRLRHNKSRCHDTKRIDDGKNMKSKSCWRRETTESNVSAIASPHGISPHAARSPGGVSSIKPFLQSCDCVAVSSSRGLSRLVQRAARCRRIATIRDSTNGNVALGNDGFRTEIETVVGQRARPGNLDARPCRIASPRPITHRQRGVEQNVLCPRFTVGPGARSRILEPVHLKPPS